MKKKIVSILIGAAMVAVLIAGCGGNNGGGAPEAQLTASDSGAAPAAAVENSGETYTLTVQQHDPEASATGQFLNAWAASINEASGGQLDIQVFHGATLGGPKDTVDMILNGTCDIGWGLQSFYADRFPVTEVFMLPMLDIDRAPVGSTAIWDFYNSTDYMDDEYADFHVLLLHTNCQSPISTVSKQIESVSDLKGMQLRGNSGPPTEFITNLGANPVGCPINELYSNLEKGEMDGCITDWHAISSFKLDETISYYLDENLGVSTYFLMMNKGVYDSLPADLQAILDEKSAEAIQYTSFWDDVEDSIKADPSVSGKLTNLSDGARAEFEAVADQTVQQWIDKMDGLGYDGQAIYDKAMECIQNAK